jgi:hypothetical protein
MLSTNAILALQRFELRKQPQQPRFAVVQVVGRRRGVVSFLLTLLGLDATTSLTVTPTSVQCRSASLFGERHHFIPLNRIAVLCAGFHRPLKPLFSAVFVLFLGMMAAFSTESMWPFLIAVLFGAAFVTIYVLTKSLVVEIYPCGGPPISVAFQPNVIEGVPVDLAKARDAIIVISDLLQSKDSGDIAATSESWQSPPPIPQQKSSPAVPETQPSVSVEEIDSEKLAKAQFERARQLAHDGDREGAISVLQDILRSFPGTQAAEIAKKNLGKTHGHTPPM